MNGSRILGNILGLHQVPNPFSDHPFPSFRVIFVLAITDNLPLGSLRHRFASLGVEAEPLGLESSLVESGVFSGPATAQPEVESPPRGRDRRERVGIMGFVQNVLLQRKRD